MVHSYHIFVDGRGYAGESEEVEKQPAGFSGTWSGKRPQECSGIKFGEPLELKSQRNLASHLERVLRRIGDAKEVVIRRVN